MKGVQFLLPFFLFLPLVSFVTISEQQIAAGHSRIRRRIPRYLKRPALKESNDSNSTQDKPKFILKCPRTAKNISSVIWSHRGHAIFSVDFGPDGNLVVGRAVDPDKWHVEEKVWRSLENRFEPILTAKWGRHKVEVENGGPGGRQWIVLKITDLVPEEDSGEWKCRIFVKDLNGKMLLKAESRKKIEERNTSRPARRTREFGDNKNAHQLENGKGSRRHWELWDSILEGRTFGFAKNDGEFAIFERMDIGGGAAKIGYAIEYTRGDEPIGGGELLDLDTNPWRWRRIRSNSSFPPKINPKLILAVLTLFSFLLIRNTIL